MTLLNLFGSSQLPIAECGGHCSSTGELRIIHIFPGSSSSISRADPVLSQPGVAWGLSVSLQGSRELPASSDLGDLLLPFLHTRGWGWRREESAFLGLPSGCCRMCTESPGCIWGGLKGFLEAYGTKLRLEKVSGVRASLDHSAAVLS